jgi:hypothetical protein
MQKKRRKQSLCNPEFRKQITANVRKLENEGYYAAKFNYGAGIYPSTKK